MEPVKYKLVPLEATQEMINAFHMEDGESASNKWDAMLAVAPAAAVSEPLTDEQIDDIWAQVARDIPRIRAQIFARAIESAIRSK